MPSTWQRWPAEEGLAPVAGWWLFLAQGYFVLPPGQECSAPGQECRFLRWSAWEKATSLGL